LYIIFCTYFRVGMKRIVLLGLGLSLFFGMQAGERKRIVSLAASITQNLYLLGANEQVVGCTRFCPTQPEDSITVVADAVNVNMEKIVEMRPDIVLASTLTPPKVLDGLKRMGITTRRLPEPRNFEEICQQFLSLGKLSGREEAAKTIVIHSRSRLDSLKARVSNRKPLKVFMEIGCNPLYTALPTSFMHDYIQQVGGKNIAQELDKAIVSKEFVVLQNPDVIFIVGMGIVGEEEMAKWKTLKDLQAVKTNRIFSLDSYICSPTPETFVETVERLIQLMYND